MNNTYMIIFIIFALLLGVYFSGSRNIFLGGIVEKSYEGFYVLDAYGNVYVAGGARFIGDGISVPSGRKRCGRWSIAVVTSKTRMRISSNGANSARISRLL